MQGHNNQNVSAWVRRHVGRITPASSILDLACGSGRHTRYLANLGHHVTALDIDLSGVTDLTNDDMIELVEHDLENSPWPFSGRHFHGIVVTNYHHRPLYPNLAAALAHQGTLIYATFASGNEQFGRPGNPDFLLKPGELINSFATDLRIVAYDHGRVEAPRPAIRQRLCAIRNR